MSKMNRIQWFVIVLSLMIFSSCSYGQSGAKKEKKAEQKAEQKVQTETQKENKKPEKMTKVLIKTSLGDIQIALYNETPQHRDNFIKLVNEKYYDGTLFHRIIKEFMIQGGDPDSKTARPGQMLGNGGPNYTVPAEFVASRYHKRGALAAARQGDNVNPTKASSGSQFYIVDGRIFSNNELTMISNQSGINFSPEQTNTYTTIGGAPFLDGSYTVFGEVEKGMDIVDKIAAQAKDRSDRPTNDIKIVEMKIIEE
jgi:cyclophilin family peptidyl-prolyl cis-trans isomerase